MPLYEYQCESCSHRFEVIQKYSDAPIDTCPKCGSAVAKLLSSPAIQFKGTGWYITDYARAGKSDTSADSAGSGSSSKAGERAHGGSDDGGGEKGDKGDKGDKKESKSESTGETKQDTGTGSSGDAKPSTTSAKTP